MKADEVLLAYLQLDPATAGGGVEHNHLVVGHASFLLVEGDGVHGISDAFVDAHGLGPMVSFGDEIIGKGNMKNV